MSSSRLSSMLPARHGQPAREIPAGRYVEAVVGRVMRRGKQQVLLHYLPGRSFDVERASAIARVVSISGAPRTDLSADMVLSRIKEEVGAWQEQFRPGLRDDVLTPTDTVLVDPQHVEAELFPRVFWCQNRTCGAVHDFTGQERLPNSVCRTCRSGRLIQLRWIRVHRCGDLQPLLPRPCTRCGRTDRFSLSLRGSERISNFRWVCGSCGTAAQLFGGQCRACSWPDSTLRDTDIEVHRAARTYYAHSTTLLNIPDQELDRFLQTPGWQTVVAAKYLGLPEAEELSLSLSGPSTSVAAGQPADLTTQDLDELLSLRETVPAEQIMAELMKRRTERQRDRDTTSSIPLSARLEEVSGVREDVWQAAGSELLDGMLPTQDGKAKEVVAEANGSEAGAALASLGVGRGVLVADFPILTATYGFSRIDFTPNRARLNAFPADRRHGGKTPIYVDQVGADAILLALDPNRVLRWIAANGQVVAPPAGTDREIAEKAYFVRLLTGINLRETIPSGEPIARMVFGLVHTFSHLAVRHAALLCGLDRTSLSEYLLPRTLSAALYCNHRFGATIGALTTLFDDSLPDWLGLIRGESRCVYDPVCADRGANCHACAHLPETSCRFFNLNLSRSFLFGGKDAVLGSLAIGYLDPQLG